MGTNSIKLRRRTFLSVGLSAAVAGTAVSCGGGKGAGSAWRFFTAAEARTVDAICAQLIPADRDPGAREAAAVNYIDIQLTRTFKKFQATYRQGIAAVETSSRSRSNHGFAELSSSQQVEVLNEVEESSPAFFDLILAHTRQGFYGDPRHGGNRGMVSWKMVGVPYPQVRGRQHYDVPLGAGRVKVG